MVALSPEDIIEIHDRLIETTGGSLGLREPGLLAAIAAKPDASFDGKELYPALPDKAAAIFEALCNYHVFVDGNKRTAITCLEYFLYLHNHQLTATQAQREEFTLATASNRPNLSDTTAWIKQHSKSLV